MGLGSCGSNELYIKICIKQNMHDGGFENKYKKRVDPFSRIDPYADALLFTQRLLGTKEHVQLLTFLKSTRRSY